MTLPIFKYDLALKINPFHFMSIGKSNEEIKEETSFGNDEFSGNNVVKWWKLKKKCGSPVTTLRWGNPAK